MFLTMRLVFLFYLFYVSFSHACHVHFFLFMNIPFKMSRKINNWKLCVLKILEDKESNGLHKNQKCQQYILTSSRNRNYIRMFIWLLPLFHVYSLFGELLSPDSVLSCSSLLLFVV
jgi:hypothetical protein